MNQAVLLAIQAAAEGGKKYLEGQASASANKRKNKQKRRETEAELFDEALDRARRLEAQRLKSGSRMSKSRAESLQDTADLLRGAFSI